MAHGHQALSINTWLAPLIIFLGYVKILFMRHNIKEFLTITFIVLTLHILLVACSPKPSTAEFEKIAINDFNKHSNERLIYYVSDDNYYNIHTGKPATWENFALFIGCEIFKNENQSERDDFPYKAAYYVLEYSGYNEKSYNSLNMKSIQELLIKEGENLSAEDVSDKLNVKIADYETKVSRRGTWCWHKISNSWDKCY